MFCIPAAAQQRCTLPAYAHNDYENPRPLRDAIEAGYAGVEVDYYLVGGRLLVGHDAGALRRDRTVESLYLAPLRRLLGGQSSICPAKPFLLNIEAKQKSQAAFDSLKSLLAGYPDLVGRQGAVRLVLVGWVPVSDSFAFQYRVRSLAGIGQVPSHPDIALVSVRYQDLFRWNGQGAPDAEFPRRLEALVRASHAVPGRLLRLYDVPYDADLYRVLLAGGVDLLGIKDLEKGRRLLLER